MQSQQLLVDQQVEHNLSSSRERVADAPPVPSEPDESTKAKHKLTHEPYAPWCPVCVVHRARQDAHAAQAHTSSPANIVSWVFGFLSRKDDDAAKLTVLFGIDRGTHAVCATPTSRKGGPATSYMVSEAARFVCWLGYPTVKLRSDCEPAIMAVIHHLQKALRGLNIGVSFDNSPIGSHESKVLQSKRCSKSGSWRVCTLRKWKSTAVLLKFSWPIIPSLVSQLRMQPG